MAKANLAASITAISGHVGGTTLQMGMFGAAIRNTYPLPGKKTAAEKAAAAAWTTMVKAWSHDLTPDQRAAWDAFGTANPTPNKCGTAVALNRFQGFAKVNRRLATTGHAIRITPPAGFTTTGPGALTLTFLAGPPLQFLVTPTTNPTTIQAPIISSCGRANAGTSTSSVKYRTLLIPPDGTAGPWDIAAEWLIRFGPFTPGTTTKIKVLYQDDTTAARSTPQYASITFT